MDNPERERPAARKPRRPAAAPLPTPAPQPTLELDSIGEATGQGRA